MGLTEEELLDLVWALPRSEEVPDALPRLDLGVDPEAIGNPHARDIIEKLQALRRRQTRLPRRRRQRAFPGGAPLGGSFGRSCGGSVARAGRLRRSGRARAPSAVVV